MKIRKNLKTLKRLRNSINKAKVDNGFDMGFWTKFPSYEALRSVPIGEEITLGACGTTACAAGHAVNDEFGISFVKGEFNGFARQLVGGVGEWDFYNEEAREHADFYKAFAKSAGVVSLRPGSPFGVASRILGLTYPEATALFYTTNDKAEIILNAYITIADIEQTARLENAARRKSVRFENPALRKVAR